MSLSEYDVYQSPLNTRYCSNEMKYLFSARKRFSTWRNLWTWLAEAERELGVDISAEALDQMRAHQTITDEELAEVAIEERKRRHDVMAHVHVRRLVMYEAREIAERR